MFCLATSDATEWQPLPYHEYEYQNEHLEIDGQTVRVSTPSGPKQWQLTPMSNDVCRRLFQQLAGFAKRRYGHEKDISKLARRVVFSSLGFRFPRDYKPLPLWKAVVMADICLFVLTACFPYDGEPTGLRRKVIESLASYEQHAPECS